MDDPGGSLDSIVTCAGFGVNIGGHEHPISHTDFLSASFANCKYGDFCDLGRGSENCTGR